MDNFDIFLKMVCEESETTVNEECCCAGGCNDSLNFSELYNWPIKLTHIPTDDAHFDNCDLLLAADCTAFAYAQFHERFIKDKVALIFCSQDSKNVQSRLIEIFQKHEIRSLELVVMDKPCCETGVLFVNECLQECKQSITLEVVRISKDGEIVEA